MGRYPILTTEPDFGVYFLMVVWGGSRQRKCDAAATGLDQKSPGEGHRHAAEPLFMGESVFAPLFTHFAPLFTT